jgi:hypothetical protein
METIETIANANDIVAEPIIPLFGITAETKSNNTEQCHFCFNDMEQHEPIATTMSCCSQHAHSYCLKTWIQQCLLTKTDVRCGYCRTPINHKQSCILCLTQINEQPAKETQCCKTYIHTQCVNTLHETLPTLPFNYSLECGTCHCLWHKL